MKDERLGTSEKPDWTYIQCQLVVTVKVVLAIALQISRVFSMVRDSDMEVASSIHSMIGSSNVSTAYGIYNVTPGRYGGVTKQRLNWFLRQVACNLNTCEH